MVLIMGIGERLKEAREEQGISLDTLQEQTKIQKRYLLAIEEENFDILPGTFYARAFIKEYAQAVGLDADEIIAEHEGELPTPEEESSAQYTRIQQSRKDNQSGRNRAIFSFIPALIVALLVIGIVVLAWNFIIQKPSSNDEVNQEQDIDENTVIRNSDDGNEEDDAETAEDTDDDKAGQTDEEEDETDEEDSDEKDELELDEKGDGDRPESTFTLNNASEKVIFEFETDGETWLDVEDEDGKSLHSSMFTADQSPMELDMSDADRVYLNVGNAPNLQVKINGTELEYPVDPNEKVLQRIWINIERGTE